jgi:nitrate/nitrite-specific signal transduction histidine kinase
MRESKYSGPVIKELLETFKKGLSDEELERAVEKIVKVFGLNVSIEVLSIVQSCAHPDSTLHDELEISIGIAEEIKAEHFR